MKKSKLYLILQTLVCIALVALMSVAAISTYREGAARKTLNPLESIYTPEIAAEKMAPIAPLLFAALGLLVAGLALGAKDEDAEKPVKDAEIARDLTVARVNDPSDDMRRERAAQRRLRWIGCGAFALCMVPIALFLTRPANFPVEDPEVMFRGLIRVFLPWTAAGLGALCVAAALREKSILRETETAKARLKAERAEGLPAAQTPAAKARNRGAIQVAIVVAAVILIVAGIFNGSARDVLYKAITICTECVGLG